MASNELKELLARVERLKKQFLPPLRPTANYTHAEQDSIRALRLLVHAEIESYLEQVCTKLTDDLEREIKGRKNKWPTKSWAEQAAKKCRQAIGNNNGVKEENIRKMFDPLGFVQEDYDGVSTLFLSKMSTFGKNRGTAAHQSALRVTYSITRQGDEKLINEILIMLKNFDALLNRQRLLAFIH